MVSQNVLGSFFFIFLLLRCIQFNIKLKYKNTELIKIVIPGLLSTVTFKSWTVD